MGLCGTADYCRVWFFGMHGPPAMETKSKFHSCVATFNAVFDGRRPNR